MVKPLKTESSTTVVVQPCTWVPPEEPGEQVERAEQEAQARDREADQGGEPQRERRVAEQDRHHQAEDPQHVVVALAHRAGLVAHGHVAALVGVEQRLAGDVGVRGARGADPVHDVAAQDPVVGDRRGRSGWPKIRRLIMPIIELPIRR